MVSVTLILALAIVLWPQLGRWPDNVLAIALCALVGVFVAMLQRGSDNSPDN